MFLTRTLSLVLSGQGGDLNGTDRLFLSHQNKLFAFSEKPKTVLTSVDPCAFVSVDFYRYFNVSLPDKL